MTIFKNCVQLNERITIFNGHVLLWLHPHKIVTVNLPHFN
jgi:hypothetical protein